MAARKKDDALLVKEQLFVASYLANANATAAAKAAGYSERTAYAKGSDLLKRPRVAAAIERAKRQITQKFNVNAERVVEEMSVIGFSDVRNYELDADGNLKLAAGAPDSAMRAIKRVKRKVRFIPQKDGQPPITEVDAEFELWSKDAQLHNLGNYLKLFKEKRADDDGQDDDLTVAQRKERILAILRQAAKKRAAAGGSIAKKAAKR